MGVTRRVAVAGLGASLAMTRVPRTAVASVGGVASAAQAWLSVLDEGQRQYAHLAFDDAERFNWHYVPRRRRGLAIRDMTPAQRVAAISVLHAGLSQLGARKAEEIMLLEGILGQIETFGALRDPENYLLTVFGSPGPENTWGWRFEGHHLSLNMTYRNGRLVAATPCFLGANPAIVQVPPHLGMEVLEPQIKAARELLASLTDAQRGEVVISDRSFGDIVAGPGRETRLAVPEGLSGASMTEKQRATMLRLIDTYVLTLPTADSSRERDRIRNAGVDALHFAWAGGTESGGPHYFRVHGPVTLIEYDNTRSGANHVHSVWHDPTSSFGRDALGQHYRFGHHRTHV